jgi:hypothetical protein
MNTSRIFAWLSTAILMGCGGGGSGAESPTGSAGTGEATDASGDPGCDPSKGEPWPPPPVSEPLHDNGSTVHFTPSNIDVTRIPVTCGMACPPFKGEDLYLFIVGGADAAAAPLKAVLTFTSAVKVGQAVDLEVGTPTTDVQPAQQTGSCISCTEPAGMQFGFSYGTDRGPEIDSTAFDRATITFLAFSPERGALISYRLQLHFVDGKALDMTFSSHLWSSWSSCPAG